MKFTALATLAIVIIAFAAMGCDEDDDNQIPEASLKLQPNHAWIYDNTTDVEPYYPEITLNASKSSDSDGEIRNYHYDFGDENSTNSGQETTDHTYENGGEYTTLLRVEDNDGDEDSVTRRLNINYRYSRTDQLLESTTGEADSADHPFPVSGLSPNKGKVYVNVTVAEGSISQPNVNITVYNSSEVVVKNKQEGPIQESTNITIDLTGNDFKNYEYGQWKVRVECENGEIQYDVATIIWYKK